MGVQITSRRNSGHEGTDGIGAVIVRVYLCAVAFFLPFMFGCQIMGTDNANFPLDFLVWVLLGFTPTAPGFLASFLAGTGLVLAGLVHVPPVRHRCPWWVVVWLLLPLFGCAGLLRTTEWDYALNWLLHFWGAGTFGMAVWWASRNDDRVVPWLFCVIGAGTVILCLVGWRQRLGGLEATLSEMMAQHQEQFGEPLPEQIVQKYRQLRVNSCFSDPNVFGAHLLVTAPVLLLCVRRLFGKHRLACLLWAAVMGVFFLVTLYWTGSRGAVIGLLVGVAAVIWQQAWLQRRAWKWLLPLLACVSVIGFVLCVKVSKGSHGGFASAAVRLTYYDMALRMAHASPLAGVGLGEFYPHYMRMKPLNAEVSRDPHSFALSCLSQSGLCGFLGMVLVCLWPVCVLLRRTRWRLGGVESSDSASAGVDAFGVSLLSGGYMAWVAHSFFQFNELIPGTVYLLVLLPLLAERLDGGGSFGVPVRRWHVVSLSCLTLVFCLYKLPSEVSLQAADDVKLSLMSRKAMLAEQGSGVSPMVEKQLEQDVGSWLQEMDSFYGRMPLALAPCRMVWEMLQREALTAATPDAVPVRCREELLKAAVGMTERAPHRSGSWERLAWAQILNGDWAAARSSAEIALSWHPGNGKALILKAMAAVQTAACLDLAATLKIDVTMHEGKAVVVIETREEAPRAALRQLFAEASKRGAEIPGILEP